MAFCSNCGTQLQGDERFCVNCGKNLTSGAAAAAIPMAVPEQLPPGAIPVAITAPQAPAKRRGRFWMVLLVLVLVGAGYYYVTHPSPKPPPEVSSKLAAQQDFAAHWETVNGYVQISNARWTNHAAVAIQSATLQCDQYDSSGSDLDQTRTTLNGPLQPGASDTFDPFQMGAVSSRLDQVKCTIVHVEQPATTAQQ